jgi:hypothetical protein
MDSRAREFRIDHRRTRYAGFLLLAVTINVVDSAITRSIADPGKRALVAAAATADLVLVVSALYYWLLVRPGIRGRGSLVPVFLLGALHASMLYPNARVLAASVGGLCEAGLIGYVAVWVRRRSRGEAREEDAADAIRAVLESIFPAPGAARLIAMELSILYYALFSWRAKPKIPAGAHAFTLHKKSGCVELFYVIALVSLMETLPVHLLIGHWSRLWAWIASSVSLYGMIWMIGVARSISLRPSLAGPEYLDLKFGLLFRLRLRRGDIATVRPATAADAAGAVAIPRRGEPNVCIELTRTAAAEGPFGTHKTVNRVVLAVDEDPDVLLALGRLL